MSGLQGQFFYNEAILPGFIFLADTTAWEVMTTRIINWNPLFTLIVFISTKNIKYLLKMSSNNGVLIMGYDFGKIT